jgi:hypothetical protein
MGPAVKRNQSLNESAKKHRKLNLSTKNIENLTYAENVDI